MTKIDLTSEEIIVAKNAISQWMSEYANNEEYEIAKTLMDKLHTPEEKHEHG